MLYFPALNAKYGANDTSGQLENIGSHHFHVFALIYNINFYFNSRKEDRKDTLLTAANPGFGCGNAEKELGNLGSDVGYTNVLG